MIKVGIVGATGYVGAELTRLLLQHPEVELRCVTSKSYIGKNYSEIYNNFNQFIDKECQEEDIETLAESSDVIFIALPHGIASEKVSADILRMTKVIDLGADFRLKDKDVYESWYQVDHYNEHLLKDAVYGLCELNRAKIKKAKLIANPGCYATCSILTLAPLLEEGIIDEKSIIIDAKSGVSGAGRTLSLGIHFNECNESVKAYKLACHRHIPEIEQELSEAGNKRVNITFTPHLIPMNRGILVTAYGTLKNRVSYADVEAVYRSHYGKEYFIRLTRQDNYPETRWVRGSNFCDIGFVLDERNNRIIALGAIDNLIKGAAGQAVQNMNIMFNMDEKLGLDNIPIFPI